MSLPAARGHTEAAGGAGQGRGQGGSGTAEGASDTVGSGGGNIEVRESVAADEQDA